MTRRRHPRGSHTLRTNVVAIVASKGHVEVCETAHVATTTRNISLAGVESAVGNGVVNPTMTHTGSSKIEILLGTKLECDVIHRNLRSG